MKSLFISFCLTLIISTAFAVPTPATTQTGLDAFPVFGAIHAHRMAKGAAFTWRMGSEEGVDHYVVQRTVFFPADDYAIWEEVAIVPATGDGSYKIVEDSILAGYTTYRVVAVMTDGSSMASPSATVRVPGK